MIDVSDLVREVPHTGPHDLINGLIDRFDAYRSTLEKAASAKGVPLGTVRIRPPLPRPINIDCMYITKTRTAKL